jgi:hypothetical protein
MPFTDVFYFSLSVLQDSMQLMVEEVEGQAMEGAVTLVPFTRYQVLRRKKSVYLNAA